MALREAADRPRWLWLTIVLSSAVHVSAVPSANESASVQSDSPAPRVHVEGRVAEFEGALNYHVPSLYRNHPERSALKIHPLDFPLDLTHLPNIMMGYFEHLPRHPPPSDPRSPLLLACHGPPCPSFGACSARFPNVQACWNPHLVDEPEDTPIPPINCPFKGTSGGESGRGEFDPECSHREDFTSHGGSALQVMRLEDVFVTDNGFAVNQSHVFVRNGCRRFWRKTRYKQGHMAQHVQGAAFNWAHLMGKNFFHFTVELVPLFLVVAPLMPTLRTLPIILRKPQWLYYDKWAAPLMGIERDTMRMLPIYFNDLIHVDVLYQPIYQDCDRPSPSLWQLLRRRHLLHPSGLPLFNRDWTYRQHYAPLSASEARAFPPDWLVVLASRPEGGARALVNKGEVEAMLVQRFGRERVVVFDGSMPILQARSLFHQTRFLLGVHGAALTNTIFMPEGAALLEMRPRDCHITVFHPLAAACSIAYHLLLAQGNCSSPAVVDLPSVARVIDMVHTRLQRGDEGVLLDMNDAVSHNENTATRK
ncbi:unnamed protein product [Closterium sp. NIES-65]|nr:unnamed protein product [Closterium sp. NIES-65]